MITDKKHDYSIDLLKAIAAILITNSHMGPMYGDYSNLATGGAIGDTLFFFCSGYTLFWSNRDNGFFNWYKRRINRIYPTILAIGLIFSSSFYLDYHHFDYHLNLGSGWFIACIFLYYILFYPIKKYCASKLKWVFGIAFVICVSAYFFPMAGDSGASIYGATYYKWYHYFLSMLLGAIIGKRTIDKPQKVYKTWICLLLLVICIVLYYGILSISSKIQINCLQLFAIPFLLLVNYLFWCLCNTSFGISMMTNNTSKSAALIIGGLCLEIYLIQPKVFTTSLNMIFPLNIPIIILGVIIAAYLIRCCSRVIAQTFKDCDYDWKAIISLY